MWDNPATLNRSSDLLLAAAGLMVLYFGIRLAITQPVFAMREIRVGGATVHITLAQVETIARHDLHGTFFTLDIERLRGSFEKLPWGAQGGYPPQLAGSHRRGHRGTPAAGTLGCGGAGK